MSPSVPLKNLAQRIAQNEAELNALRLQYEARQTRLAELNHRKKELQAQLQRIDAEIQNVDRGATTTVAETVPVKSATPASPASTHRPQTLSSLLIELVRGAQGPITVKRLSEEVKARKFPSTSKNLYNVVQASVHALVSRGIFQRVEGQPGVILVRSPGKVPLARTKADIKGKKKQATQARSVAQEKRPLRSILSELLSKSKKPLTARELAEQVRDQGRQTKSKKWTNVVSAMLSKMNNVQKVPGQGYRLK
jgi:Fe2+ or Zn2+ uptake regulation protein